MRSSAPSLFDVFLSSPAALHFDEDATGVRLLLPASQPLANGLGRALICFYGFRERFSIWGVVEGSTRRFGFVQIDFRVPAAEPGLKALLNFAARPAHAPRIAPRYPLGTLVGAHAGGQVLSARIQDVSATGCYLRIPGPHLPQVGAQLELRPPDGRTVPAEVVRVVSDPHRGVGLRFVAGGVDARAQVQGWVRRASEA